MADLEGAYAQRKKFVYYKHVHGALKKVTAAYAMVLSILVTVTFIGFLQPPRGLDSNHGFRMYTSFPLKLFIVANSLSLYSSICGLVFFARTSFSSLQFYSAMNEHFSAKEETGPSISDDTAIAKLLKDTLLFFYGINVCLIVSVSSCVAAYVFAGIAVVRSRTTEQILVLVMAGIGVGSFGLCLYICGKDFPLFVDASSFRCELWPDWRTESLASWLRFRTIHWQKSIPKSHDGSGSASFRFPDSASQRRSEEIFTYRSQELVGDFAVSTPTLAHGGDLEAAI